MFEKVSALFDCPTDDIYINDTDSNDENKMNNATPALTPFEMKNILKSEGSYLNAHFNGEKNNKLDDIEHFAFNVVGSIAYHHLTSYLATLDLNTLSNLNTPNFFLELIGNKREFIFSRKMPKKISGNVPYRFVTTPCEKKTGFIRNSQTD
ncbi:hypothetical protein TNCV_3373251 [Trichonephila clavipes]|nr:hypothetical protein TNCV_3373251 [Trichonephila clavipes]